MSGTPGAHRGEPRRLLDEARSSMAGRSLMTREEAHAIVEKVRKLSKADEVTINVSSRHTNNVRFAANQLSTSGGVWNMELGVTSTFGKRHASASTNDLSDASLARVVAQSESLARLSPEDPEWMPPLGPQTYLPVGAYFDETAKLTAANRARSALAALEPARRAGDLQAAGFLVVNATSRAVANARGLFGYHRSTNANYTMTVRTRDGTGSGWAGAEHNDWKSIDAAKLSETAMDKARRSRDPVAIEPGRYTVILEPQAVGDLVQRMSSAPT